MSKSAQNKQVGGDHYKNMKIQPGHYSEQNGLSCYESFVVKYVSRHRAKNGRQDLEKAIHCLELLIEECYPEPDTMDVIIDGKMTTITKEEAVKRLAEMPIGQSHNGLFHMVIDGREVHCPEGYKPKVDGKLEYGDKFFANGRWNSVIQANADEPVEGYVGVCERINKCCGRCDGHNDICIHDNTHNVKEHPDTSFIKTQCETCRMPFTPHGCGCSD